RDTKRRMLKERDRKKVRDGVMEKQTPSCMPGRIGPIARHGACQLSGYGRSHVLLHVFGFTCALFVRCKWVCGVVRISCPGRMEGLKD
ncbi:hypothetical protein COCCADRAFT_100620, partial [Bipolaris zeicola 26-R-13]